MTPEDLRHLVAKAAEGHLSPQEAAELLREVRKDPSLLDEVVAHISTERLIRTVETDPQGTVTAREIALRLEQERFSAASSHDFAGGVAQRVRHSQWRNRAAGIAALLALSGAAWWTALRLTSPEAAHSADGPPSVRTNLATPTVALIKSVSGVRWADPRQAPSEGELLGPGKLRIESGTLLIVFMNGARVLLLGPAELELVDESHALLHTGRLSAHAPAQARGFTIATPDATIVDLGTSFGVVTGGNSPTELHVFEGSVSFTALASPDEPRQVPPGQAVRLANRLITSFPADPKAFPNGEEMARRQADERASRIQLWRQAQLKQRDDPDLILSYTFEEEPTWEGTVTNHAKGLGSDGTVVGAGWSGGRWPGKHGLEFRGLGDRLRFEVPGAHQALTLVAWVRVDSLPNPFNALLMPVRYQPGSLHWNLDQGGELRAAMRNTPSQHNGADNWDGPVSAKAMGDMDLGIWTCLAATYDSQAGEMVLYRDGQELGRGEFPRHLPAVLNEMDFGNWGARPVNPDTQWIKKQPVAWSVRNFVGRLDELLIFGRTLDPEEMSRLYEDGKP